MKKTLAILLSLALVVCMIPAAGASVAFAADKTNDDYNLANATIELSQDAYIYDGTAKMPTVTVKDKAGDTLTASTNYTVTYSTDKISVGTVTVTVTGTGTAPTDQSTTVSQYYGTKTKTYTISKLDLNNAVISTTSDILSTDISNKEVQQTGKDKIKVKVGNFDVTSNAKVTKTYTYTAANGSTPASVTVTVSCNDSDNDNVAGKRSATFTVKTNIASGYDVKLANNQETFTYNGSAQTPRNGIVVYETATPTNVLPSSAYSVSYSDNVNGGKYPVITVTGIGQYSGTITKNGLYYINQKSITSSDITVTVGTGTSSYNPKPVVKDGSTLLTEGTDYNLEYLASGNQVKIKGIGNYTGERTETYTVVDDKNKITRATFNGLAYSTYDGYSKVPGVVATLNDSSSTKIYSGFDYVYTKDGKVVSEIKDAGTYTVKIVGKNPYAGDYTVGTYTVREYSLTSDAVVSVSMASATSIPAVTVRSKDGYVTFTKDKDYTYTYNVSSGKVSVYLRAIAGGNLTGSKTATAYIVSKAISSCSVYFTNGKSSTPYTGYSVTPSVTVKDGSTTLTQNTNYTITYKDSLGKTVTSIKDAGTYTVTVTGMNGYTGSTSLTFTVTGNSISSYNVTLSQTKYTANGSYITKPTVTSVYSGSSKLSSSDYTVTYQNSAGTTVTNIKAPGTYKVVVTGAGKYTGTTYATFTVVGKTNTITGVKSSYKTYADSDQFELYPEATKGKITYSSSDPSVASVSSYGTVTPLKAGRAKITITAAGDDTYESATISTVIKVYPAKATLHQKPWTAGKGKVKVRWDKQDNVTYYQIKYSRDKKFSSGTYKTVTRTAAQNDYTTQSTTIKNLKSGSRYYFKVRAVKEVYNDNGKKLTYYGSWSTWKSVKVQ